MSKRTETKDHVITRDKESLVPLDPGGIVGSMIGHETDRTAIRDKETGNVGVGLGKGADDKAWDNLRSKNEADKR